jgi:hypothetical protein
VIDFARYGRQMLLPDIGEEGQIRLGEAVAEVGGTGLAHEIASRYALGAGMGRIVPGTIDEAELCPSFLETAGARAVLAGSRAALLSMRRALGVPRDRDA